MPRLRNSDTGVVVNVSDDTAASLDQRVWKPAPAATAAGAGAAAKKAAPAKPDRK